MRCFSYSEFIKKVSHYLENVVIPEESQRCENFHTNRQRVQSLERKARFIRKCGAWTKGIMCKRCDSPLEGSGLLCAGNSPEIEAEDRFPRKCGARACPHCGKSTAQDLKKALTSALSKVPTVDQYEWRFVTATIGSYDPSSFDDVGTDGLRFRAKEIMKRFSESFRELQGFKKGRRKKALRKGMAAFAAVELSGTGHVHLHAVLYSTFIDFEWMEAQFGGFVDIKFLGGSVEKRVKEAAKYAAKICSPLDEGWIGGKRRELIHPELAARWEAATWRLRLRRVFGELHGLMGLTESEGELLGEQKSLTEDKPPPGDPCKTCGSSTHWAVVWMGTTEWIQKNHRLKQRAFKHSRWESPDKRAVSNAWKRASWFS